jgi:hypothetical protein
MSISPHYSALSFDSRLLLAQLNTCPMKCVTYFIGDSQNWGAANLTGDACFILPPTSNLKPNAFIHVPAAISKKTSNFHHRHQLP